ncbi:MAG: hypothetical protein HY376_00725 [Candidatus Blackburnbacteria bacterium]|nr:hypothetical protein [Candidatus Blackburnbacteria bacterium]
MKWTANLAYAVGLITSDGCLSKDGRHIDFTSKDIDQIRTFAKILGLSNKIATKSSGSPNNKLCYRIQFGSISFYHFLVDIGLTPRKSKTINALNIPDLFFADFLRGLFDGDGYTYSYWDKRWKHSFLLYLGFVSASKKFLAWIQSTTVRLYNVSGALKFERGSTYSLKFAKRESIVILQKIYYQPNLPHLKRKYSKIQHCLGIIGKHAGVAKLEDALS